MKLENLKIDAETKRKLAIKKYETKSKTYDELINKMMEKN